MATTVKITDGTDEVDFNSASGFQYLVGGVGKSSLLQNIALGDYGHAVETLNLKLTATSHDNAATQLRTLNKLLRKAKNYQNTFWQSKPVYLEVKTANETNTRYATILNVKEVSGGEWYDAVFKDSNLAAEFKLALIREHPWRSSAPGSAGTAVSLSPHWNADATETGDFNSVTQNGSSTFTNAVVAGREVLKVTLDSTPNTTYGSITRSTDKYTVGRFKFDINSITMTNGDTFDLCVMQGASVGGSTYNATIELKNNSGTYQMRATANTDGAVTTNGTFADITDDWNDVLVEHRIASSAGADDGYCKLWVNGTLLDSVTGIDNDQRADTNFHVGCVSQVDAGTASAVFYIADVAVGGRKNNAQPTEVHVANFRDDVKPTHIFTYDNSGTTYSSNLLNSSNYGIFPATAGDEDIFYIGSTDGAPKVIRLPIGTAGSFSATFALEYYNGAAWTALTLGTNYTVRNTGGAVTTLSDGLATAGDLYITINPPSDISSVSINSATCYWIRIRIDTFTSMATVPDVGSDQPDYIRHNYIEIPAASILGDAPPLSLARVWANYGGGTATGPANISRILIGAKSEHGAIGFGKFEPYLHLGNVDNPSDWATNYGTDSAATADFAVPGNAYANVTFSTDATMVERVELVGTDMLAHYEGEYRVFVVCQQIGGSAGDCNIKGRVFVGGSTDSDTHVDTFERATRGADAGWEVLDLGLLRLPLTRKHNDEVLTDTDIAIQLHCERTTGTSRLGLSAVYLFPIAEGSVGVDDPVTDGSTGASALRGNNVLDIDNGVVADRNVKYRYDGTNLIPLEEWARFNRPPEFENLNTLTRLYFLFLSYSSANSWNTEPLILYPGTSASLQMFFQYSYNLLRGGE